MSIEIRRAAASELDDVARLLVAVFSEQRPPLSDAELFARYLADIANVRARHDAEQFVAVEAGRVIGAGSLYAPDHTARYPLEGVTPWPRAWAALRLLGVDPAHRGRGIARLLIDARTRRARELGAAAAASHTSTPAVRAMYGRAGWRREPAYDYWPIPSVHAEAWVLAL